MRIALDAIEEARAQTRGGRSVPYATAFVYLRGTTTEVTVYEESTGTDTLTQPLDGDLSGRFPGYVDENSLDLLVDAEGWQPRTQEFEAISGLSPGGRELGRVEATSILQITGNTAGDGTGATLYLTSVTLGVRPVKVILSAPFMHADTDQQRATAYIQKKLHADAWTAVGGSPNQVIGYCSVTASGTGAYNAVSSVGKVACHREITLSPADAAPRGFTAGGVYDFRVQIQAHAASKVMTVYADDVTGAGLGGPASLSVEER